MGDWRLIALGALVGMIAGALTAFAGSLATLQLKRLRNAHLASRGKPAIRDVVLVTFHLPGGVLGLVIGAIASAFDHGDLRITAFAAVMPWVILFALQVVGFALQAFR